ncbi:MAG: RES family NAD+ phosphorylase [Labilithrix sp.]|nr:RES family NAD+ phosphorylase [Labilithrix sp.]
MAKLPEPPQPLTTPPETKLLLAGTRLWRIYLRGGSHPTSFGDFRGFGPTTARFDHHDPPPRVQSKGILYAADDPTTCLAEAFQATRVVERHAGDPWLVGFETARDLTLLDLTGAWPTRAGASMALSSGPRPRARRWSQAIYDAYPRVEGLWYPSSMHANRPSVALYERADAAVPKTPSFHRALSDPAIRGRLDAAAMRLGYRLV